MAGVSYSVPMNPHVAAAHATAPLLIRASVILKSEGASGFSKYYIVGKEILDLSTQQQGTESILVNFENLLFVLRF